MPADTATAKKKRAPMFGLCLNSRSCVITIQIACIVCLAVAVFILAFTIYQRYFYILFNSAIIGFGLAIALSVDRWRRWNDRQKR